MPRPLRAIAEFFKRDWQRGRAREKIKWDGRQHRCTQCWYDMVGTVGDVCPECGTPKNRAESIWTNGRWHWRVSIITGLIGGAAIFAFWALDKATLKSYHAGETRGILAIDQLGSSLRDRMDNAQWIILVSTLVVGLVLIYVTDFLAIRRVTSQRHENIRRLVSVGIVLLAFMWDLITHM